MELAFQKVDLSLQKVDLLFVRAVLPNLPTPLAMGLERALLEVLYSLQLLSHQGCAFRGHDDVEGNFYQLLNLL